MAAEASSALRWEIDENQPREHVLMGDVDMLQSKLRGGTHPVPEPPFAIGIRISPGRHRTPAASPGGAAVVIGHL